MSEIKNDWPVSTTGGKKITGHEAEKILKISYSSLYSYLEKDLLMRAEKRRRGLKKQPLMFFLADVVALALEHEKITEEEAAKLLSEDPKSAAATVAA